MAYHPIGNTGWSLAVGSFENEILAGVRQLRNIIMAVSLGALVLGVLLALWLGRAISSPIKEGSKFADTMSYGDFSNELPSSVLNRKDEIGILARSFDRMQKSLREMLSKVKAGSVKVHQSSESLAASAEEMSASLEQVASSANEFSSGASNLSEPLFRMTLGCLGLQTFDAGSPRPGRNQTKNKRSRFSTGKVLC